jgi:hypothetical protein
MRSLRRWLIDAAFFCAVFDIGYRVLVGSWLTLLELVMAIPGLALGSLCVFLVRRARSRRRPDGIWRSRHDGTGVCSPRNRRYRCYCRKSGLYSDAATSQPDN